MGGIMLAGGARLGRVYSSHPRDLAKPAKRRPVGLLTGFSFSPVLPARGLEDRCSTFPACLPRSFCERSCVRTSANPVRRRYCGQRHQLNKRGLVQTARERLIASSEETKGFKWGLVESNWNIKPEAGLLFEEKGAASIMNGSFLDMRGLESRLPLLYFYD